MAMSYPARLMMVKCILKQFFFIYLSQVRVCRRVLWAMDTDRSMDQAAKRLYMGLPTRRRSRSTVQMSLDCAAPAQSLRLHMLAQMRTALYCVAIPRVGVEAADPALPGRPNGNES